MPTHGSLTKAGKVRSQTPKITPRTKRGSSPRVHGRRNFVKRFVLNRESGQNWVSKTRRSFSR